MTVTKMHWHLHRRRGMIPVTDKSDRRLELLHENVKRYGAVFNTVNAGCELSGTLRRGKAE